MTPMDDRHQRLRAALRRLNDQPTLMLDFRHPHLTHTRNGGHALEHPQRAFMTTRVEAVAREPRRLHVVDADYDAHVWEIAGQSSYPIGMPVNIARRRERRRERLEIIAGAVGIVVGAAVILFALFWFTGPLVRTFWGG